MAWELLYKRGMGWFPKISSLAIVLILSIDANLQAKPGDPVPRECGISIEDVFAASQNYSSRPILWGPRDYSAGSFATIGKILFENRWAINRQIRIGNWQEALNRLRSSMGVDRGRSDFKRIAALGLDWKTLVDNVIAAKVSNGVKVTELHYLRSVFLSRSHEFPTAHFDQDRIDSRRHLRTEVDRAAEIRNFQTLTNQIEAELRKLGEEIPDTQFGRPSAGSAGTR